MLRNHHTLQSEMNCAPPKNFGFSTNRLQRSANFPRRREPIGGGARRTKGRHRGRRSRSFKKASSITAALSACLHALLWIIRFGKHPQYSGGSVLCNIFVFCTGDYAGVMYSDFCASRMFRL
jgi:hypothetical protein